MLLLAHASYPGQFEAATVNHGLRKEAQTECAFVEQVCNERGIACAVLTVHVPKGNVQAQAREARYAAFEHWVNDRGLAAIMTAHQADDQAETMIMRLNRGSGVAGLAGVRRDNDAGAGGLSIVRPLLGFRRVELENVVSAAGLQAVKDPSNQDDRFDRVRIRQALADVDWIDPLAVAQSAQHLADANEALDYEVERFWKQNAQRSDNVVRLRLHPMRETRLRLMTRAIHELGGSPRGSDIANLDDNFSNQRKGNVAGVMVELRFEDEGPFFHFSPEPPRRS